MRRGFFAVLVEAKVWLPLGRLCRLPRMDTRALRNYRDADDDEERDERGRDRATDVQSPISERLIEKVANGCAQRSGQNEGRPEQQHMRNRRPIVKRSDNRERRN